MTQFLLQGVQHVFGIAHVARRRLAHANHVFAFGLPGIHGIEAHHPKDFAALDIEGSSDALLDRGREIAHRLLDLLQDGHQGAGLIFVPVDDGVHLSHYFRAEGRCRLAGAS